uniref:Uncharacterized protein n=1 Tax=Romanomermis culicivorax TaxID=13658 RepID=A0A915I3J0_ROMCU
MSAPSATIGLAKTPSVYVSVCEKRRRRHGRDPARRRFPSSLSARHQCGGCVTLNARRATIKKPAGRDEDRSFAVLKRWTKNFMTYDTEKFLLKSKKFNLREFDSLNGLSIVVESLTPNENACCNRFHVSFCCSIITFAVEANGESPTVWSTVPDSSDVSPPFFRFTVTLSSALLSGELIFCASVFSPTNDAIENASLPTIFNNRIIRGISDDSTVADKDSTIGHFNKGDCQMSDSRASDFQI